MLEDIKIDYVFPFVDPCDINWQQELKKYKGGTNIEPQRFRDWGFLRYLFRGLSENLPWLNHIVLLVASESQIPNWLNIDNKNVRVVTHGEFIPERFLPTFNSNTIEMFLPFIHGLSEHIIYGNDDLFPLLPCSPGDYFTNDGVPRVSYRIYKDHIKSFSKACQNNWLLAASRFGGNRLGKNVCYRQFHESQPITLTLMREAYNSMEGEMLSSITRFRNNLKNYSQYVYFDYVIAAGKCVKREKLYTYYEMSNKNLSKILSTISGDGSKWVCLNDTRLTSENVVIKSVEVFEKKYPNLCEYEKEDNTEVDVNDNSHHLDKKSDNIASSKKNIQPY